VIETQNLMMIVEALTELFKRQGQWGCTVDYGWGTMVVVEVVVVVGGGKGEMVVVLVLLVLLRDRIYVKHGEEGERDCHID